MNMRILRALADRRSFFFLLVVLALGSSVAMAAMNLVMVRHLYDLSGGLEGPTDVAVALDGTAYVVDGVHDRVVVYGPTGRRQSAIGGLSRPLGVAVDSTGRVYVADSGNRRVQILNASGSVVRSLAMPPGPIRAPEPTDVAVDEERRRLYAVDNDNHRVVVFDLDSGAVTGTMGRAGHGRGQYQFPFLATLDGEGQLYVVDVLNGRVQVIGTEGGYVWSIGRWGVEGGMFYRPKGVALDGGGRVLVSDSYLGVIQLFDRHGRFLGAVGDSATGKLKRFETPTGLATSADGRLFVVETTRNRVRVFQLDGGGR